MPWPKPERRGGYALRPETGRSATIATVTFIAVAALLINATPMHAGEWSGSGSFDLKEGSELKAKLKADPPRSRSPWGSGSAASRWVALDRFERSQPGKAPPAPSSFRLPSGSQVAQLFALIAFAEAPRDGYDAVHGSATRRPSAQPTAMTLGQIFAWIDATPGQHHAIGRYQIIPSTLLNLRNRLGMPSNTRFDRRTQDRMAALLISDAGYDGFRTGRMSLSGFQDRLAKVWAGLPLSSGKSAYHGYAGNRATITRSFYDRQMAAIFGASSAKAAATVVRKGKGRGGRLR